MMIKSTEWRKYTVSEIEHEIETRQQNLAKNIKKIDQLIHNQKEKRIEDAKAKLRWELFMLKQGFHNRQNQLSRIIEGNSANYSPIPNIPHPVKRNMIIAGISTIGLTAAYIKHKKTRTYKKPLSPVKANAPGIKESLGKFLTEAGRDVIFALGREFLLEKIIIKSGGSDGT